MKQIVRVFRLEREVLIICVGNCGNWQIHGINWSSLIENFLENIKILEDRDFFHQI